MSYRENCTGCTERDAEITRLRAKAAAPRTQRVWINLGDSHHFDIQHGVAWLIVSAAMLALAWAFIKWGIGDPMVRRGFAVAAPLLAWFRWVMTREVQR